MRIEQVSDNKQVQQLVLSIADSMNSMDTMSESKEFFMSHPYYPLLKNELYDIFYKQLEAISGKLVISGTMGDSVRNLVFSTELKKSPQLFVRYLIEDAVDKAFKRKVGEHENISIETLIKLCNSASFRSFYHQIVYLRSEFLLNALISSGCESSKYDDGIIAYGYIDTQAGLSFKAICCANLAGNRVNCSPLNNTIAMTLRADTIEQAMFINLLDTNCDISDFVQTIDYALTYEADEQVTQMRLFSFLDNSRHPQFPDDIRVILHKEPFPNEVVWVRCKSIKKDTGLLLGQLLNEPNNDFGVQAGELIGFKVMSDDSGNDVCIHLDSYK